MSKHRVLRVFPTGSTPVEVDQVIDTTDSPQRNIASLVERRFLEPVPDDTPLTETALKPAGGQPRRAEGRTVSK